MSPPSNTQKEPEIKVEESEKIPEISMKPEEIGGEKKKIEEIKIIKMKTSNAKEMTPLPAINDISILKTEQKTRNFLQGDYTLYHIKFSPCNHIIQRKFNDFRKLRIILQKLYPYIRLPYI